jgi:cystathionine beta-synthase
MSAGTGGTISGTARKLREKLPNIRIVGVDPYGSILALPQDMNPKAGSNHVEGIGYDFIPKVIDRTLMDDWIKTDDAVAFPMSRRLIKSEGILCGGSAGATMWAAVRVAKTMKKGERCVVLLADSVRNYMTKFLNDGWMVENGYMEKPATDAEWWSNKNVSDLKLASPLTVSPDVSVADCISVLREAGVDQLPVVGPANEVVGMVTLGTLTSKLLSKRVESTDCISSIMFKGFQQVTLQTPLSSLQTIFDRHHFALVVTTQKVFNGKDSSVEKSMVFGVVTPIDLTHFIVTNEPPSPKKSAAK